ncbi:MAG: F0F1 ATP synthase subunit delta, partial [Candidatus Marinimicrobia bacterium]|nr:F0F1 ATP synthase subunit delta [Candidatus Neomarinimicrobiota bacterium]
MKQNHKKIKIYSESLCSSADTFENFQSIKRTLEDLIVLSKKDLTINTFLKSKLIDSSQKMDIFKKAFNEAFNKNLLDILLVMIEHDDINLLVEVNKNFVTLAKKKLNIAYVEV